MKVHVLEPGASFGPYEILRRLGAGAGGDVYLARLPAGEEPVALKVLRADPLAGLRGFGRFRREARATSRIRHENVAATLGFGTADDVPYLAMEYVDGPSLEQAMMDRGLLPMEQVLDMLAQLARGLEAAHGCRVVHRDLKPRNVALAGRQVKILDFGLAKILEPEETAGLTPVGTIVGTPLYMSPEQVIGQRVDLSTDIYSFGVLAFELIAGQPPFQGNLQQILRAHVRQPAPPPSTVAGRHVASALDRLVTDCLAKEPGKRPASASLLLTRLMGLDHRGGQTVE